MDNKLPQKISAILIDDNPDAIYSLKLLIKDHCEDINVIAETTEFSSAIELINEKKPGLIFLDIELNDKLGFDILERVTHNLFQVICVTGFRNYSIRAINYDVTGYILKPVAVSELKQAVRRVKEKNKAQHELNLRDGNLKHLFMPDTSGYKKIYIKDISFIEAEGSYTTIYCGSTAVITCSKSLNYFEDLLLADGFHRIHRKYLVSLQEVDSIKNHITGTNVTLRNSTILPVSHRQKRSLIDQLHKLGLT